MRLIKSESEVNTMEENCPVVTMPVLSAIDKDVSYSLKCLSEDPNKLDNGLAVIREKKSVFLTDCAPLWGCSSVCGQRPEMEDAYVAVPRFFDVPIWMLTQDCSIDGVDDLSKFRVPAHFFGVYDGHGGAQVSTKLGVEYQISNRGTIKRLLLSTSFIESAIYQNYVKLGFIFKLNFVSN